MTEYLYSEQISSFIQVFMAYYVTPRKICSVQGTKKGAANSLYATLEKIYQL